MISAPPHDHEVRRLVIRPRSGWIAIDWRELWESRELLYFLVLRDVKVRYKQTVLGVAWAVLQPLFTMLIFTLIFGRFAKIPSDGVPYALFVFAGLLPWTFFSNNISQASMSLMNQQTLLTKIYLPRLFIPSSSIGSGLIDLLVSFGVFAMLMIYYGVGLGPGVLMVPFLVQSWLYLSPVIYPVSMVPPKWQPLLAINPMAGIIDGFRSALLGLPWNYTTIGISSASSLVLLAFGLGYFRKTERSFADVA